MEKSTSRRASTRPKSRNTGYKDSSRKPRTEIPPKPSIISKRPLLFVGLVCAFAVIRVFVFSAAFPFFNNVDEPAHFDTVYRYSQFNPPAALETYDKLAVKIIHLYATPEYLGGPETFADGVPAPPFKTPNATADPGFKARVTEWNAKISYEAAQPPAYYAVAGMWLRFGRALGLGWGQSLYWIRFLNVPLIALLVWVCYFGLRRLYPDKEFIWFGVPLLVAFMPQDLFYSIHNGAMTPVVFALAFFALAEVATCDRRRTWFYALTGLACGLSVLVLYGSIAAVFAAVIVAAIVLRREIGAGERRRGIGNVAAMLACAAVPVGLWFVRSYWLTGAFTQEQALGDFCGWTRKPLSMIWNHPIFTLDGFSQFWHDLTVTFWRGEFVWHGSRLAPPSMDSFYATSSSVFVVASIIGFLLLGKRAHPRERIADALGYFVVGVSVLFLVAMSLRYDFGTCMSPSILHPFFSAARMIGGITVPFLVMWVKGLDFIMGKLRINISRIPVLAVVGLVMAAWSAYVSIPVFSSPYNWFHMF